MKKLLFLGLATGLLLASCSNDEVLESAAPIEPQAIAFKNPFLDKNTRADLTTDALTTFYVYGCYGASNTNVFDGVEVTNSNGNCSYSSTAYWKSGESYKFAAYSNGNGKTNTTPTFSGGTLSLDYTNDGTADLIYATATATGKVAGNEDVKFSFGHKLAKVYFTFTNSLGEGVGAKVTALKLSGVKSVGTWSGTQWTSLDTDKAYDFNDVDATALGVSSNEVYMIPQNTSVTATFTVTVSDSGGDVKSKNFTATISAPNWAAGNVYNYTASITTSNFDGIDPIVFGAEVSGWASPSDGAISPTESK